MIVTVYSWPPPGHWVACVSLDKEPVPGDFIMVDGRYHRVEARVIDRDLTRFFVGGDLQSFVDNAKGWKEIISKRSKRRKNHGR